MRSYFPPFLGSKAVLEKSQSLWTTLTHVTMNAFLIKEKKINLKIKNRGSASTK